MIDVFLSLGLLILLLALLASGLWIALSIAGVGFITILMTSGAPPGQVLASTFWGASYSWELAALPLFIWMGEILMRSRLSDDLFAGLAPWLNRVPGRLLHINVLGCGLFSAVSGSSAATAATVGKIALPELRKRGYDEDVAIGTLAGAGTLGLLIPPSIILIVYGIASGQSVIHLFMAGILPGIMVAGIFMGYVMIWALLNPSKMPPREASMPFFQKVHQSRRLFPLLLLIGAVIGSIYLGLASPTDAAAVGVALSLLMAYSSRTLTWASFVEGALAATRTSCMIAILLLGSAFLTVAMGFAGIPSDLARWIGDMNLSPHILILALTLFFIVVGCFLDGISIVVLTTSIILPMVEQAGIDLIWFGIYVVIVVEMSSITPPVGFNLFVIQGLTRHDMFRVAKASLPFFGGLVLAVFLLTAFPEIATYLPQKLSN
ncbi:TRAP transporter large permease [Pollutimonas thiosulfatoxidans]|uniref:TRAP transporter large permease protein n=1 Tax=Pollutimonas thiosulfatoxidans TaxID=2028345 RepID=A0A410GEC7_9BURK|nr:TRAP transporter large permease subunit [Pollutimonas thiosulfatoxidans]QAA94652.1 C4-dicarboxylate ABC transporter permease [Pollutimonas thiosulfatoxidans]